MNVKLKSVSIPVLGALLLSIGTMGGCRGLPGVSRSEILTNFTFTATRRTEAGGDSKGVWVVEPCKAVTKTWSDKGTPNFVFLSPESFEGNLTVTFGAPEENKVIVTAKAIATRTWRNPWLLCLRRYSQEDVHSQQFTFTCDKDDGIWDAEGGDMEVGSGGKAFAAVRIAHAYIVRGPKDTSTLLVKVVGQYGSGSYKEQPLGSQGTTDWSTTYARRYGLAPDSPSK